LDHAICHWLNLIPFWLEILQSSILVREFLSSTLSHLVVMETLAESRKTSYQAIIVVEQDDGRVYPLVDDAPKCLLPLANRKLLAYQLDVLAKSGVMEVYIVAPAEYQIHLSQFLSEYMREALEIIDLVTVEDMMGSADGLRAVSERIRGDFIFMAADVFIKGGLGELTSMHQLKGGDVTMLLAPAAAEEPDPKKGGRRKLKIEEEDQEFIAFTDEHRILKKIPKADLEENFVFNKPLLHRGGAMSVRSDLLDLGVYVFSYWVLELLNSNRRFQSVKNDLLPFLIDHQHQPASVLVDAVPAACFRRRNLASVEPWMHASEAALAQADGKHFELMDFLAKDFLSSGTFTRQGVSSVLVPPGLIRAARSSGNTGAASGAGATGNAGGAVSGMDAVDAVRAAGVTIPSSASELTLNSSGQMSPLNASMSMLSDQMIGLDGLGGGGEVSPKVRRGDPVVFQRGACMGGIHGTKASRNYNSVNQLTEKDILRCFAVIAEENGDVRSPAILFGMATSVQGFTNGISKANASSFVTSSCSDLPSTAASAASAIAAASTSTLRGGAAAKAEINPAEPPLMLRITSVSSYQQLNKDITLHTYDSARTPWPRVAGYQKKEMTVMGEGVSVLDKVTLKACTIGHNVSIGAKTKLNNCIIMDNASVAEGSVLQNCVLCAGAKVESNCNLNECLVAAGATVSAGMKSKGENFAD
jgi:NDP-sugar pyrophosphorylase family protein